MMWRAFVLNCPSHDTLEPCRVDVNNIRGTLGRFAPDLLETEYAREMWALFEQGELTPDATLIGLNARDATETDPESVLVAVEDARQDALQRELGRVES